ncbi:phosphatidate cytidylyltransferase [Swaminathania salitolerans]|uniref:Phosphatidate cytidylyltransferase n=1 Tax=Swaminathania salitolerans TaxID=182838 RepID=A0A511BMC6_9PROT|nr:phosphatidate cytidylyltransferase [Swaminathania salitolerans]GBQ15619.1 phosphatidate cytidylyltransferase [Swaminathania salitolerans LMG 21291]GEL01425.1 phosphatidate cytidylyltransferase [Swaminathania salitolerans]
MTGAGQDARWSDLRLRLLSAAAIVPVALICIVLGGWLYRTMIFLVSIGLVYEATTMAGFRWRRNEISWRGVLLLLWPVMALVVALKGEWRVALMLTMTAIAFGAVPWACVAVAGFGGLSLLWLRDLPETGIVSVLFIILVVIASDSGAYLCGRVFGGPKLAPRISPGKTRSGALGGLCAAGAAGLAVAWVFGQGGLTGALAWGGILGFSAQCGDLVESAAKRRAGVKDSGRLIPGHGGLLDRFDGLLAAAPLAALVSLAVPGSVFWKAGPADLVTSLFHPLAAFSSFPH